jgi:uncharacterized protein with ParB-like and HNH nuclease domain/predicted transport protein
MKATEAKLLAFLKKSPQFVIPIYQRTYSWTEHECQQLWEDILRTGRNDDVTAHFVGSIVYVEKGLYSVSSQAPLLVIDGQQRLTTVTLLVEALARSLGDSEPIEGFSARKLRNYYLLNPEEDGDRRYKLVLSQTDKASLVALLDGQPTPKDHSIRVEANFEFFKTCVAEAKDELAAVCKGLAKLVIVDISLSRDQDNPQLIFESLNSTGRELSQADLIRNFILMGLEPQLQTKLYEQHWRPMELDFGQEGYAAHFDGFMRHYLTVKTGEIPNVRDVYKAFKQHARSPAVADAGVEALVADIRAFAGHYCAMALGGERDLPLAEAFQDIRELKVDVAYPFLLELYADYTAKRLEKTELLKAARLVESYVFRRAVCGIPTNSMNKTFATFSRAFKKDRYLESIEAHFLLLPSYRRFPTDEEFQRDIKAKDLYGFRSRSYWLRRLENHDRKERVAVNDYTIEHILPQNENLSDQWKSDLGPEWERIQHIWLHTLGNLTLTGYNPELSDRPFAEKRQMKGGFADSPLRLNQGLGQLERWTEETIKARAERLSRTAVTVWGGPSLAADVLDGYRPTTALAAGYTIDDHPNLVTGPMRELFHAFRAQVLALDPCVSEEFLKLYVAYKAETNFVDIVPQKSRLRLSLNMRFHEIDDPRQIARDVTGLGRWGNGDVEVGLSTADDLPYIMGLVRQAFEKQMGNGETDA